MNLRKNIEFSSKTLKKRWNMIKNLNKKSAKVIKKENTSNIWDRGLMIDARNP